MDALISFVQSICDVVNWVKFHRRNTFDFQGNYRPACYAISLTMSSFFPGTVISVFVGQTSQV